MRLQLGENARMALKNVRENKTRSVLTIVGVVIGITALIVVASILVVLDADMLCYLNDNAAEDLHRSDVIVIGHDIADVFFGGAEDPLGKVILVDNIPYTVIGVEEKRKGQFFKDQSADRAAKVPWHTYQKHYPKDDENFVGVAPYAGMKAQAEDQVREVLRRRRHVAFNKPDNFGISSAEEIATQFRQ